MNEQLKIVISAEIDKLKKGVDDAKKQVKSFKEQVKDASKNVDDNIKSMGEGVKNGLKVVGTTIAAAGAALLALGASSAEYRAEQAKLNAAFETAGASAETAKSTYNDLFRVLGDGGQATEAAAHLAKLTTEEKALSEWTNICQGVYATFGDSLPIEGLTEAANETAKVGTVTGGLADALNWAGISEDAFNEKLAACNDEAEREKLIRETLNGVYNEAAANYEKTAADTLAQNEAQAKLQETTAKLGEAVAPVITAFTAFANDALAIVVPYIQDLSEKHMPQLKELLSGVSDGLQSTFDWASKHKELLAGLAITLGIIVTAIGLYNTVAAVKAAMAALEVTTVWGLVAAYAAQAAAVIVAIAPYVLIVAAIAAVIAIIVLCVKHWDKIKAKIKEVWNNAKKITEETVKKIVAKFNELKDKAAEKIQAIKDAVANKFNEIKNTITQKVQAAKEALVTGFSNMVSSARQKAANIVNTVAEKFGAIKTKIKEKIDAAKEAVKSSIEKMKSLFNFSWSLPKPKFPKFSVSGGEAPWGFMGKGSLPKISIKWNRLGGIFDTPTITSYNGTLQGLGEDGAEAIVPLEKNTKWLDRLATMLNDKQGGNRPIILEVDGKTFAQIAVSSINDLTKQTGNLPLKLA